MNDRIKLLAFGIMGALIALSFWPLRATLTALGTLFHETGHALIAWLTGHPSVPAFDLMFGGGITHYGEFRPLLAVAIGAGIAYLAWRLREHQRAMIAVILFGVVWLFVVTSQWRREVACCAAGETFKLIFGAVFLYMVLANVGWRRPEIERPLGSVVAFFMLFDSWAFCRALLEDPDAFELYMQGKGGALMNDLEVISLDLRTYPGWEVTVPGLVRLLIVFSIVVYAVAAWLGFATSRRGDNGMTR